jgi:hypothetical protein
VFLNKPYDPEEVRETCERLSAKRGRRPH